MNPQLNYLLAREYSRDLHRAVKKHRPGASVLPQSADPTATSKTPQTLRRSRLRRPLRLA